MKVTQAALEPALRPDAYRLVDFARAVRMLDERDQELRVNRVRLGAPVDRESHERVTGIVLNGAWFDVSTTRHAYRVHVTNVVSAER